MTAATIPTISIVSWDQLPKVQRCHVSWLDERECCPMVQAHAHGGPLPEDAEVFACPSYAAGNCKRAGAFVLCAFHDFDFDWKKARDWQRRPDGFLEYRPRSARRARRKASRS